MFDENNYKKRSLLTAQSDRDVEALSLTTSPVSGFGGYKKRTGPYSAGFNGDQMSGNWSGWDGLRHVLDNATFSDVNYA